MTTEIRAMVGFLSDMREATDQARAAIVAQQSEVADGTDQQFQELFQDGGVTAYALELSKLALVAREYEAAITDLRLALERRRGRTFG